MVVKKQKHGLGRGLGALIKDVSRHETPDVSPKEDETGSRRVSVEKIVRSTMQPRKQFDAELLAELAASIRAHGVLQPLLVRPSGDKFELIAGERRFRAAIEAGLKDVPVLVLEAEDSAAMELALVENLQRDNLNIMEEAGGYIVLAEKFNLTQEQIAEKVGKSRAAVANAMRLLLLPDEIKKMVMTGGLSAGHAKVISGLDIEQEQILFARRVVKENLSVRNLEKLVNRAKQAPRKSRASSEDVPRVHLSYISDKMHAHYGTSVRLTPCRTYANGKKGKGMIEIDYFSNDDLGRILSLMGIDVE